MDMLKTVREIGFFETSSNLVNVIDSCDIHVKVGNIMPLPTAEFVEKIPQIAEWLTSFGKDRYLFFTPEIALVDKLAEENRTSEAIILVPCDMDTEVKERLKSNLPKTMNVSLLAEPYFPGGFYPGNGLLIICGYLAGERMMVLPETYRMIEHYSGFFGKKVFVPYVELHDSVRYDGWMEVGNDKINLVWRAK